MKRYIKNFIKFLIPFNYRETKLILWIRLANYFNKKSLKYLKLFCESKIYYKYSCDISAKALIGKNLRLPHPLGIVIGEGVKIGDNVRIYQNVTIGRKNNKISHYPEIGDRVIIYANSLIIGKIKIADDVIIGANSVVKEDILVRGTYAGIPLKKVK